MGWTISEDKKYIHFTLETKSKGWVGLGFSPTGKMAPGSDIIMCYIDSKGVTSITDRYANARLEPELDTNLGGSSDVEGGIASQMNDKIIYQFSRKIKPDDRLDHEIFLEGYTNVIWAYGRTQVEKVGDKLDQHLASGSVSITFEKEIKEIPLPDKDVKETIIQMTNVKINDIRKTNYICKNFKISQFGIDTTQHAIRFKSIRDNTKMLHHIVLYSCKLELDINIPEYDCFTDMPPNCEFAYIWAVGTPDFTTPDDVGYKIEKGNSNFVLQIHYENLYDLSNQFDSSGIKMYTTPNLRSMDIGIITNGQMMNEISIPPKNDNYEISNTCQNTCSSGDINIFYYFWHMHLIGRKMVTKITRDGEILYDNEEKEYDFNRQDGLYFEKPLILKKNDFITTNCVFNSMTRSNITKGGFGSTEEMCFNFIYFYPRINGPSTCSSFRGTNVCNKYKIINN